MPKVLDIPGLVKRLAEIEKQGTLNADDADRSENLHRLFMYPAMMVPAAQTAVIEAVAEVLPDRINAIDPFMGSGTSLMSCMERGYNVFGQDINPFAVLLSKVKVTFYDIEGLRNSFKCLKETIEIDKGSSVDISFTNIDKWFKQSVQIDFSKLRRAIISEKNIDYRRFYWVIFSEVVRIGSNDRTSTFKLHKRCDEDIAKRKIDVINEFYQLASRGIEDLENYKNKLIEEGHLCNNQYSGSAEIAWGNTQIKIETEKSYDLLVSSPPYGDNMTTVTYGQTCYLPLQWIDPLDIECPFEYLKTTQEIDRQSLGGHINGKELDNKMSILFGKSASLLNFYNSIPKEERPKYNKTISFMYDFDESLDNIIAVMNPDAFYIWTIGNRFVGGREVPNSNVLTDLMNSHGIKLLFKAERQILNKKQAKKNSQSRTMEKEHILIFHKEDTLYGKSKI